jgi:mRNA interferase MazF
MDMEKDFDGWNKRKKLLHISTFSDYVHAREVWWCALGINIGVEADGKHENFERPILVIRKFNKDSILVVPLTSRFKQNPYHIPFKHGGEEFAEVISQMRLISTNRLLRLIYKMDTGIFKMIQASVCEIVFQMPQTNRPPLARGPRWPHDRK